MSLAQALIILLLALPVRVALAGDDNFVFTESLLRLAVMSAELNTYWYNPPEAWEDYGFENFTVYKSSFNYVFFAQREGYCFTTFKPLDSSNIQDVYTMVETGVKEVCNNQTNRVGGTDELCCSAQIGFVEAYYIDGYQDFEGQIRECADQCKDPEECVVFAGWSKGAAVSSVAAVALADLKPYVFFFGQVASVVPPCPVINTDRWFNFVAADGVNFIEYDPVPFLTAPASRAQTFGHMIVLGNDPSAVAYMGLDYTGTLSPWQIDLGPDLGTHGIVMYLDRLQTLVENIHEYPVPLGFNESYPCTEDKECASGYCTREAGDNFSSCSVPDKCKQDDDCDSGLCVSGTCSKLLQESCMQCYEDSECDSGKCWYSFCTGSNGLMDDNCACFYNSDCASGRCSWSFTCESSST